MSSADSIEHRFVANFRIADHLRVQQPSGRAEASVPVSLVGCETIEESFEVGGDVADGDHADDSTLLGNRYRADPR